MWIVQRQFQPVTPFSLHRLVEMCVRIDEESDDYDLPQHVNFVGFEGLLSPEAGEVFYDASVASSTMVGVDEPAEVVNEPNENLVDVPFWKSNGFQGFIDAIEDQLNLVDIHMPWFQGAHNSCSQRLLNKLDE